MSRIYDNWERLVAAVVRREEIWQLCHADSTESSIRSDSSDFSSTCSSPLLNESLTPANLEDGTNVLTEKHYKPGIYVTLVALSDGTSRIGFEEQHQAVIWWFKDREKICRRYNACDGNVRMRQPYVFVFSTNPLFDHQYDEEEGKEMRHNSTIDEAPKSKGNGAKLPHAVEKSSDLSANEMIALQELKHLVQEALNRHELSSSPKQEMNEKVNGYTEEPPAKAPEEVFIWA